MKNLLSVLFAVLLAVCATSAPAQTAFVSSPQIISGRGAILNIAHGLGQMPTLVQARLKCLTAEAGYAIGDEVIFPIGTQSTAAADDYGLSVFPNAVNINVVFGTRGTTTLLIVDKASGSTFAITNSKWRIIFRAWVL